MKIMLPLRLELKAAVSSEQMVMMRSSCDPARVTERENKKSLPGPDWFSHTSSLISLNSGVNVQL